MLKAPRVRRQRDSSRTRVGPVFGALSIGEGSDPQWVRRILDLASESGSQPWRAQDLRVVERHHHPAPGEKAPKERSLAPPVSLLRWLLRNFTPPKNGRFGEGDVGRKRRELADGNPTRLSEALEALDGAYPPRAWYVLEGYTAPDVYLVTPDALIVVEGKRTEAGPTTSTTWMAGRHQMLRHLDAAWEIRRDRSVYGLFIVEAIPGTVDVPTMWRDAAAATRGDEAIRSSLPHRGEEDRQGIREAFVGVTTWQRIVAEFGLTESVLL